MFARLALAVLLTSTSAVASAQTFQSTAKLDCRLRLSSLTVSDVVIFNRGTSAIPAQTYFKVRSDAGAAVTVVAPNGIRAGGQLNVRHAKIAGDSCTATVVLVNAP